MDSSILFQKGVRDNNEDLQNFMRDMKHWENSMKEKDQELSKEPRANEVLPPVRKRNSKNRKNAQKTPKKVDNKNVKPKERISSFDYSSWDKFDVEKACEDVEGSGNKNDDGTDSDSDNEETRLQQQANYEKELGNRFVKAQKWKEAIEQYTKAINCYNKNAIFFANRALCYLKTKNLKSAEADCTESLKLNPMYVKAYQRRAAARADMKKFKEAQVDLEMVLKLEPKNKEAKKDLDGLIFITEVLMNKQFDKQLKKELMSTKTNRKPVSDVKSSKAVDKTKSGCVKSSVMKIKDYKWDPVDPVRIVNAVNKPPHLRSKKPLTRIEIVDVDNKSIGRENKLDSKSNELQNVPVTIETVVQSNPVLNEESRTTNTNKVELKVNSTCDNSSSVLLQSESVEIPSIPKNSVQFCLAWKLLKNNPYSQYLYLKKIDGRKLLSIFQDSLESDLFSSIITTLSTEFIKHDSPVLSYLEGLTNIRRFSMLVLFMSKQDKEGMKKLVEYCIEKKEVTIDHALKLKKEFQLV